LATADETLPVRHNFSEAFLRNVSTPQTPPPGANDWSCKPSAAHPRPVVLVHGTLENMHDNWDAAAPLLANNGYCVFALNFGGDSPSSWFQGTGDIAASAHQLAAFIDRVRSSTGADKVDVVGHSQGGMMPRYYLKNLGGAAKVHHLIGLAPSNHGTTLAGMTRLGEQLKILGLVNRALDTIAPSMVQQQVGSDFLKELNAGGDTVPGVRYTVIATKYDEIVTPYTSSLLNGPNVDNIVLQDHCAKDRTDHLEISYDPIALAFMLNALDPRNQRPVPCLLVLPLTGPVT
jgi:triacylglycerol esterase/lipase EstA (alpha/beta hydrolase family)